MIPSATDDKKNALPFAEAAIALAGLAAYGNSLAGEFIYDDRASILQNPTIRDLGRIGRVLNPALPGGVTVNGRPVLNLSLALNYAASGTNPWSYHAFNLAVHICAGLALFGIARRTLLRRWGAADRSLLVALAAGLWWTVHPLLTEAVSYTVQRAESLMGLFYFLTLYCFIRGVESSAEAPAGPGPRPLSRDPRLWFGLSWGACLLGMGTKEVMVTAPVIVFLYDRTFLAGSFREAWRLRRRCYLALAATWIPLALLVLSNGGNRGGSVGFGTGVSWLAYALTQFEAVTRYLLLSIWPNPLIFEYGTFWITNLGQMLPWALVVIAGVAATAYALRRRPAAGFLGAWFLIILAPTSLSPGTTQMIVEHRAYLSAAAVVVAGALGLDYLTRRSPASLRLGAVLCVGLLLGLLTFRRNEDYRSNLAIWTDTVAKRPQSLAAQYELGNALDAAGRLPEAIEHFVFATRLAPNLSDAHYNLGYALFQAGRLDAAAAEYRAAIKLNPANAQARNNLAVVLTALGRTKDAAAAFRDALKQAPDDAHVHDSYGNLLLREGRLPEAEAQYAEAVRLDPGSAVAQGNLGSILFQLGKLPEAVEHLSAAVQLDPSLAPAQARLADALMESGRPADAVPHYEEALRFDPKSAQAQSNLGMALAAVGRLSEAVDHYQEALRLDPDIADTHFNLANAFFRMGHPDLAAPQYQEVLRLHPDDPQLLAQAQARLDMAKKVMSGAVR